MKPQTMFAASSSMGFLRIFLAVDPTNLDMVRLNIGLVPRMESALHSAEVLPGRQQLDQAWVTTTVVGEHTIVGVTCFCVKGVTAFDGMKLAVAFADMLRPFVTSPNAEITPHAVEVHFDQIIQ